MTEKLYYQDSLIQEFQATVQSIKESKEGVEVILDRTAFYPGGGGQPHDLGQIDDIPVLKVYTAGDDIVHLLEKAPAGKTVTGKIDWSRRMDYAQQHTGQHIVSQALVRAGNFPTVSVHFGEEITTIEIDSPSISPEDVERVEQIANEAVCANHPVKTVWVKPGEIQKISTRRPPPAKERIRLVEIGNFERTACGGVHVPSSGMVGWIKIIGQEKIRGHVRLILKIGERARMDYAEKINVIDQLQRLLTCGQPFLAGQVEKMQQQLRETQHQLFRFQAEMVQEAAREILNQNDRQNERMVYREFEGLPVKLLREFVNQILQQENRLVFAVNKSGAEFQWIAAHSLVEKLNLNPILQPLLKEIGGKGGGRPDFVQGIGNNIKNLDKLLNHLKETLKQESVI